MCGKSSTAKRVQRTSTERDKAGQGNRLNQLTGLETDRPVKVSAISQIYEEFGSSGVWFSPSSLNQTVKEGKIKLERTYLDKVFTRLRFLDGA